MPPGCSYRFTIIGACRILMLRIPLEDLHGSALAHGIDAAAVKVTPKVNVVHPVLARLAVQIVASQGEDDEPLTALALCLATDACPESVSGARCGGIPPSRLRRVFDRVQQDLGGDLGLAVLAREASMSPYHFARAFRRSTGSSPHAWVVRQRVEHAIELLDDRDRGVGEIARTVGFNHASHLARAMRQVNGMTPRRLRRVVLP